jgi:hypothetical protein
MNAINHTIQTLTIIVENLPIGTNLALLQFMWMLVSGRLLASRGALFPALKATGLAEDAVRRAWAAFRGGVWRITLLLRVWQDHVAGLPGWQYHEYEGYRPVGVDITAFFRPSLRGCPSKHYHPLAQKAIPAVIMGIVGQVGSLNGQRLALPREFLRVEAQDGSEVKLQTRLIEQVVRKLNEDEAGIFDAGFRLKELQSAELKRYVIRLPKNFTARRNQVAPYKNIGRRPTYGEWVRPLSRQYDDHEIAATPADREVCWEEGGCAIRAEIWEDLIRPGLVPDPKNSSFWVVAIHDPLYREPWLLATELPIKPLSVKRLYQDRWPVEQIPLAAKHMVGADRQFVFAQESIHRLPELALLAGSLQSFLAATFPAAPTGFWDRKPRRTPGRLRRLLADAVFPSSYPLPARIREKNSVTDHLPKGIAGYRRTPGSI